MKSAIQILQEFKEKAQQYYLEDYKYNQNLPDEILSEIVEVYYYDELQLPLTPAPLHPIPQQSAPSPPSRIEKRND
ncbi:MAG: hypothetical protein AAFP89_14860 [Bacteroidota bacterium]